MLNECGKKNTLIRNMTMMELNMNEFYMRNTNKMVQFMRAI